MTRSHFLTWGFLRWALVVLLLISFGTGAALVFSAERMSESETKPSRVVPVGVREVQPVASFLQRRTFTGMLAARRASELTFRRTGTLTEVLVDDGQRVQANEALARLDLRPLLTKQRELRAQRDEAQAVLDELIAGPRKEILDQAEADVRDANAQLARSKADLLRAEELASNTSLSPQELDRTKFEFQSIRAKLESAQYRLSELRNGTRKEKLDAQRAIVARLDAMLASLQVDIEDSTLKAPFAGTVGKRFFDEGTIVSPNQVILRIVEDGHLEARIGVPTHLANTLQPQTTHTLVAEGEQHSATLRARLPELDTSTRTTTLVLDLPRSTHRLLLPGQIARFEIAERKETTGFWVPTAALTRGVRGLWTVYVVGRGEVERVENRDVEVLYTKGDESLVRGTLQAGDRVIVSGDHRVVPGQRVKAKSIEE